MKAKWLLVTFALCLICGSLPAQGLSGTFHLEGVQIQYYDVARDSGDAEADIDGSPALVLSWPSAVTSMFDYPVSEYAPGDTIAAPITPDELLTPEGLAAYGIDLTITLNSDGTFQIPTSTYPTTTTENCSTYAYIPTIQDAGTYEWDGVDNGGGFGVVESNIFDLYSMDQSQENHGWVTVVRDGDGAITTITIEWDATDGPDSDSGVDTEGNLNRIMGVAQLPADQDFVAGLNSTYGLDLPVGDFPTAGENWPFDEELDANWMYLFDPAGDDGDLFSGDELLQFTSYYFTYNDMTAIATFTGTFSALYDGTNLQAAIESAADQTLTTFGVSSEVIAAILTAVYDYVYSLIVSGMDIEDALVAGVVYAIGAATEASAGAWTFPDDSDHDYDPITGDGRLVFEMGNQCTWDKQTRVVYAYFESVEGSVEHDSETIPETFALQGNYPNPFNPTTNIVFDLDKNADVKVIVYSVLGQEINTIYQSYSKPGRYTITWRGKDALGNPVPSGVYLYKVQADHRELMGKMLLIK
ncbi:MAG: FlgD immunoglobulin-like domain containing protein [Fidelibacterota bacterium]